VSFTGLHHVAIETRRPDVDACCAFFALLGFDRVEVPEGLRDIAVWVQRDALQVHLLFADEPVIPPRGHLAVACPDFDETVAALRAAGHRVEPRDPHWGSPRVFAEDPAGHVVEVMAFPPGA
jgi:catechol 2,3-dioxygenase-like lactoylglutathione lyase family enzyme